MNLSDITTKPWILALFKRDDGERFLLGDGYYDFKDSLQHFQPNSIANDIVELQGADGQLLAGQVRRSASQAFDGYIGDGTTAKQVIEQRRKDFLMFFRKKHFYTVIYIFCDGSAIQRKRGYLVDAPSVPEIRQKSPEYHVALNFEDVNYYEYAEDAEGEEIFSNTQDVAISTLKTGGLVWDEYGAVSEALQWANFQALSGDYITISDGLDSAPLTLTELDGEAEQTRYDGKNLLYIPEGKRTAGAQGTIKISYASELNPGGGFVWEDGGNSGTTTITIDGVDSALPTWTINGPATNPTLTNITTGQTITWTGTVPAGQTLIIDMNNQTAMMEGANVYAFITGSWIGLAPGANRLSYNVLGTDQPSTLSWNNIVG